MKKSLPALFLCLGLCLSLCACDTGAQESGSPSQSLAAQESAAATESQASQDPTPEAKDSYAVGEEAECKGVKVTLTQVEESSGTQFFQPEEGKVFLLCHFEIANDSEEDLSVSSMLCFDAYVDDYTTEMSLNATVSSDENQLDGTVAAGKKMAGIIGYEVDETWKELEINFKPSVWGNDSLTFVAEHP